MSRHGLKVWLVGVTALAVALLLGTAWVGVVQAPKLAPPADPAIAYVNTVDGDLMVMNADGTNKAKVHVGGLLGQPSWSPDGRSLAVDDVDRNAHGLWRVDVTVVNGVPTGASVNLGECGTKMRDPAWSPLGNEIVAASLGQALNSIPPTGGPCTTIYTAPAGIRVTFVAWSSDATRLAFVEENADGPMNPVIKVMERATGTVTHTLVQGQFFMIIFIDWARQGRDTLTYAAELVDVPSTRTVYTMDIATGVPVAVIGGNAPSWSPDNAKIAFSQAGRSGGEKIFTVTLATGGTQTLANNGRFPDWRRF